MLGVGQPPFFPRTGDEQCRVAREGSDCKAQAFSLPAGKMRDDSLSSLCDRYGYSRDFAAAEKCLAAIKDKKTADLAAWRLENSRKRFFGKD